MKLHKNTRCFNLDDFIIQTMTTTIDDHTNCLVTSVSANYMWNCFYNLAIITFMFLEKLHDNDNLWQTTLVACRRKKRMIVEDGGARVQNPFLKILLGSGKSSIRVSICSPRWPSCSPLNPVFNLTTKDSQRRPRMISKWHWMMKLMLETQGIYQCCCYLDL